MIWLVSRPVVWPLKVAFGTGRLFGYRRLTTFLLGVAVGMLVSPVAGPELRRAVKQRLGLEPEPEIDLATLGARSI